VRPVKEFARLAAPAAVELLHRPDKPAGVEERHVGLGPDLATELFHRPDKPAGVR
jgi:hypothetical protein